MPNYDEKKQCKTYRRIFFPNGLLKKSDRVKVRTYHISVGILVIN